MSTSDVVALITAIASATVLILGAIGTLWVKLHSYQQEVNGKMQQLLDVNSGAAFARGQLAGPAAPPETEPTPPSRPADPPGTT